MTRKHFKSIANAINENTKSIKIDFDILNDDDTDLDCSTYVDINYIKKDILINELSLIFMRDNSLFNKSRFVEACNKRQEV